MENNLINNSLDPELTAGQKLMVGFEGTKLNSDLKYLISELKIGGIVLFSQNIQSPGQLKTLLKDIIEYAELKKLPKLFIAIDQEGGEVARLKKPFAIFKGNPFIRSIQDAHSHAEMQSVQLKDLNINMNFAPVLDVVPENFKSVMAKRALPGSAEQVAQLGCHIINKMQECNIMAVAKHFPGIGRTDIDSHFELPIVKRDIKELFSEELIPFKKAVRAGVSGIMLSHILYPEIDDKWQASLSVKIAKQLLRNNLNYKGLIITDDLDMKAVQHDIKTSAEQIMKAGIDIVLICHKGPAIEDMFKEFKTLIKKDREYEYLSNESFKRILYMKHRFLDQQKFRHL